MKRKFIFVVLLVMFLDVGVRAAFIDPGWGARGAGKGGAFIASVDDASSIMWNPAGLSLVFMREGMFSYHKPYAGLEGVNLNMGYFSFVYPVEEIATFGVSATMFDGDGVYVENTFRVSAARELSEVIDALEPMKLAVGLSIKYLTHRYIWDEEILALNDPITEKDSAGAPTVDLGILFQPIYEIPIGISAKNLLPADVGLVSEDIVPIEAALGVAYRARTIGKFEDVVPEIKIGFRNQEYGSKINYALGVESWFNLRMFGIRMGVNNNELAFGTSFEKFFENIGFRLDYAAKISFNISDNMGSHRVSTSVKF